MVSRARELASAAGVAVVHCRAHGAEGIRSSLRWDRADDGRATAEVKNLIDLTAGGDGRQLQAGLLDLPEHMLEEVALGVGIGQFQPQLVHQPFEATLGLLDTLGHDVEGASELRHLGVAVNDKARMLLSDGTPWRPLVHVGDISRTVLAVLEAGCAAPLGAPPR